MSSLIVKNHQAFDDLYLALQQPRITFVIPFQITVPKCERVNQVFLNITGSHTAPKQGLASMSVYLFLP